MANPGPLGRPGCSKTQSIPGYQNFFMALGTPRPMSDYPENTCGALVATIRPPLGGSWAFALVAPAVPATAGRGRLRECDENPPAPKTAGATRLGRPGRSRHGGPGAFARTRRKSAGPKNGRRYQNLTESRSTDCRCRRKNSPILSGPPPACLRAGSAFGIPRRRQSVETRSASGPAR